MERIIIDQREGQRLDNFLFQIYKSTPNSHVYRMLRKGRIRVNGKVCRDNCYRLVKNDVLSMPTPINDASRLIPNDALVDKVRHMIVQESEDFWLLNKPPRICVHQSERDVFGVVEVMRHIFGEAHLVHRIDRNTSGCLMIAKHYSSLAKWQAIWRDRGVEKKYILLAEGPWRSNSEVLVVEKPLLRQNNDQGGAKVVVSSKGKPSKTVFRLKKRYGRYLLLEAEIITGRTHQIRVHAASMGFPIVGDGRYGVANNPVIDCMFLHAESLTFPAENNLQLTCEMTASQKACLQRL